MTEKTFKIWPNDDPDFIEETTFITKAENEEDALYKYARDFCIKDEIFKELIESRTVNDSFWEIFLSDIFTMENSYAPNLSD